MEKITAKIFIALACLTASLYSAPKDNSIMEAGQGAFYGNYLYSAADTVITADEAENTLPAEDDTAGDTVYMMKKSPLGSVLRSAVLPGWGQLYTKNYWKIPVIWGFLGYYGYYWFRNQDRYDQYKGLYDLSIREGNISEDYRRRRDSYRNQRDLFAIYIGITYAINLLDAYVDAHLFDFSVEPDMGGNASARLSLRIGF